MWRVFVRSRSGNVVLAVVGALYALLAIAVLTWFVADVGRVAALLDRALQFALLLAAACGVWFVVNALENLGVHVGRAQKTHK